MKDAIMIIGGILLVLALTYGGYWIAKNVSYWLFYEDMVRETVTELVKQAALK